MKRSIILIIGALVFACDDIRDDDGGTTEISFEGIQYGKADDPIVVPIYGDFSSNDLIIGSNSDNLTKVETIKNLDGVVFVKFLPGTSDSETVDLQLFKNDSRIATGSLEVRAFNASTCANTAFSDNYVINAGELLEVDLTQNDAFCDFFDSGSRGASIVEIANTDNVQVAVAPGTATLTYQAPDGFQGQVQFIYEICFGISDFTGDPQRVVRSDNCDFYYTALATIDVQ